MGIDLKELAKKFVALEETFDDQTLVEFKFLPRRFIVERFVDEKKQEIFRVNQDGNVKVVRYFSTSVNIRRQDKFNKDGQLISLEQTEKKKASGSQIRLRGNGKTWIHKERDSDLKEVLDNLSDGKYTLLIGPTPGTIGHRVTALHQLGKDLRSDFDIKKLTVTFKVNGDNLEVKCGKGKKFVSYPLAELK